jgi:hypothetical protein
LREFLAKAAEKKLPEMRPAGGSGAMLEAHLPLKRAMYAVDPAARRLLRRRLSI